MKPPLKIHVTGASGSGTTTLGKALGQRLDVTHFDSDNFFWLPTDPPFTEARDRVERVRLLAENLAQTDRFVLSGSVTGWGDSVTKMFDLVVFLQLPTELRLERLRSRELARYSSNRLGPDGDMHETSQAFLKWAEEYDDGGMEMRSLALHEDWLSKLTCPILRLEEDISTEQRVQLVTDFVSG